MECVFCKIAKKELEASVIFDSKHVMAFLDINPANEGHALVIAKEHYETIFEMPDELLAAVMKASKRIATAQKKALSADAVNVLNASGKEAGQSVFHFHLHIIPRYAGDNLNERAWWKPKLELQSRFGETARRLRDTV